MTADSVRILRLVVDDHGQSHFLDGEVPMTARDFAPPAAPLDVSDSAPASAVIYWRAPVGWDGQQHPAPSRQWAFILSGAVEVQASDGESRRFEAGDGILLEDVSGAGHTTRVVSDEAAVGVFVQVPV